MLDHIMAGKYSVPDGPKAMTTKYTDLEAEALVTVMNLAQSTSVLEIRMALFETAWDCIRW